MNTIFSGSRTKNIHRITRRACRRRNAFAYGYNPHTHGIHEDILLVAIIEIHFTAHRRNTKGIAVIANALHHAFHQPFGAIGFKVSKSQAVQLGNRPGPHGKNIAVDTAHAGGCTLIGLNGAWMVMAFYFKTTGKTISNIHQTGIFFAGGGQHLAAFTG